MRIPFFTLLCFLVLVACQSDNKTMKDAKTAAKDVVKKVTKDKYTLTPFSTSPSFPDAKIKSMTYEKGKFNYEITGNYELGVQTPDAKSKMCANSGKGQHIHLIVDKEPYAAKYVPTFDYDVEDGEHHILSFLSRSYHESIKSPGASVAMKAMIKDGNIASSEPVTAPTLFYSRPKGTYVGKENTDKVMLDFFLVNATLTNGYTVKAAINGEMHTITKWQPYYIEGLPLGDNTITLTLLKDGKVVDSPINPVSRTFNMKALPAAG